MVQSGAKCFGLGEAHHKSSLLHRVMLGVLDICFVFCSISPYLSIYISLSSKYCDALPHHLSDTRRPFLWSILFIPYTPISLYPSIPTPLSFYLSHKPQFPPLSATLSLYISSISIYLYLYISLSIPLYHIFLSLYFLFITPTISTKKMVMKIHRWRKGISIA